MSVSLRIATFNLENFDEDPEKPEEIAVRISAIRPQLQRLKADVLCLQEVNSQKGQNGKPELKALKSLIKGTAYENFHLAVTRTKSGSYFAERNLVILSRFPLISQECIMNKYVAKPKYRKLTSDPPEPNAKEIEWERPLLYAVLDTGSGRTVHVINCHLKSKLPTSIDGQYITSGKQYHWKSAAGWAEGYFISSMKRVGQALEIRGLLDWIFGQEQDARIVVCGDMNSDFNDVPVNAIRGRVEETNNVELRNSVMVPCEFSVPEPARYSLLHLGERSMIDHIIASKPLIGSYVGTWIFNEDLTDESGAFRTDALFPESDHAPVLAEFQID